MNRLGHAKTLIAGHPHNTNALKSGAFSPVTLAARVSDVEAAIRDRPAHAVALEIVQRELAALVLLAEAMDDSLEGDGIRGRQGEPRNLVQLRLRLNEKLRRTVEAYLTIAGVNDEVPDVSTTARGQLTSAEDFQLETVAGTIARLHERTSIGDLDAVELDPEVFLRAVILTSDLKVTTRDRLRARKLLTARSRKRADNCTCYSTLMARDEIQLREWVVEARDGGVAASVGDASVAAVVRQLAKGERLQPWEIYRRSEAALRDVVEAASGRVRGNADHEERRPTGEDDPTIARFWRVVLSRVGVLAKDRLDAFAALDDAGVLPHCSCDPPDRGDPTRRGKGVCH